MDFWPQFCTLFAILLRFGICLHHLNLSTEKNGLSWLVKNENKTIQVAAHVPGGIYSDLRNAGILEKDIYYRSNDELYRWVANDNWTFCLNFTVPRDWSNEANEVLIFHGIDTVAKVSLNGVILVSNLDNMFVRHILNVTGILKYNGLENELNVHLVSPVWAANLRSKTWPRVVPDCVPSSYHGECHANLLRKIQSSFAWDWGPAFPSSGIWKDVELLTYNGAILRDVTVHLQRVTNFEPYEEGIYWKATFVLNLESVPGMLVEGVGKVELYLKDKNSTDIEDDVSYRRSSRKIVSLQPVSSLADKNGECQILVHLNVSEEKIFLWWPNGMGLQPLYTVVATFKNNASLEVTSKEIKIGFRTIELVEEPVGLKGLTFYFKVNGIPVFAKGSNWIPIYALPEFSVSESAKPMIQDLLFSAKEIGINMLRVWGGGTYESDYFYELADELGILIWQDMMFACSMYPTEPSFLDSVKLEVKQQVRRLQYHTSLALWAGNNENEAALRQNWYGTAVNFSSYLQDYVLLYDGVIKNTVLSNDPSAIFLMSSPTNGLESMSEGYVAKNPQSTLYGDIHYYNYLSNGWDPYTYPLPRFASEYGFQSLPSVESLRSAGATNGDWGTKTDFFKRRQHHVGGYQEMAIEIQRHIVLPSNLESEDGMARFIYLTQINQAMGLKVETEAYRRGRGRAEPGNNGTIEGGTMGALYWQLNDIWQAPSWATLEFGGKWKMAHYFAGQFFSYIYASPLVTIDDWLQVFLLSDIPSLPENEVLNCSLIVCIYPWDNPCPLKIKKVNAQLSPSSADLVFATELQELLKSSGCNGSDIKALKRSCFLTFQLKFDDEQHEAPLNFLFLASPKEAVGLKNANLTIAAVGEPFPTNDQKLRIHYPSSAKVRISSDGVALFVWLEAPGIKGRFSDNGFLLAATEDDVVCIASTFRKFLEEKSESNVIPDCPFYCSKQDNATPRENCCQAMTENIINSNSATKIFDHTVIFYFREPQITSTALRESLRVTHLMS